MFLNSSADVKVETGYEKEIKELKEFRNRIYGCSYSLTEDTQPDIRKLAKSININEHIDSFDELEILAGLKTTDDVVEEVYYNNKKDQAKEELSRVKQEMNKNINVIKALSEVRLSCANMMKTTGNLIESLEEVFKLNK